MLAGYEKNYRSRQIFNFILVKSQLNNTKAFMALIDHPEKLDALVKTYNSILDDVSIFGYSSIPINLNFSASLIY